MIQRQNGREDQREGSLLSDRTLLSVSTFISFNWATRVRQSSCEAEVLQVFKTNSLNLLNTAFQYVTQQKIRTEIKGPHILFKAIKVHHISKKDLQDNLLTLCIQTDPRPTHWYKYRFNFFFYGPPDFFQAYDGYIFCCQSVQHCFLRWKPQLTCTYCIFLRGVYCST